MTIERAEIYPHRGLTFTINALRPTGKIREEIAFLLSFMPYGQKKKLNLNSFLIKKRFESNSIRNFDFQIQDFDRYT